MANDGLTGIVQPITGASISRTGGCYLRTPGSRWEKQKSSSLPIQVLLLHATVTLYDSEPIFWGAVFCHSAMNPGHSEDHDAQPPLTFGLLHS